jgi:CRP-like cAMP-binding protein
MNEVLNGADPLIRKHPFLAGLPAGFYHFFAESASIRRFAAQQLIFQEGGEADHFYLIIAGSVALETYVPGCGMITIQEPGAGDALGWSWLFPCYQWHFSATTREPTDVLSFDARVLRANAEGNLQFHDELVTRIAKTLYQRLLGTRAQLIDLYGIRP